MSWTVATFLSFYRRRPTWAGFLATHRVEIIASLPYYKAPQTDAQRGEGVFDKSMEALRRLNQLGYGKPDSGLVLNLVQNPVGAFLPPKQDAIESQFRKELRAKHGIEFNRLYTITNMPISRFLEFLVESGNYEAYMAAARQCVQSRCESGVMCRYTLSVGWDGTAVRLRFQPNAGPARRSWRATSHPRFQSCPIAAAGNRQRATIAMVARPAPAPPAGEPSPHNLLCCISVVPRVAKA